MKKTKYLFLALTLTALALLISGCRGSGAVASGWPGITIDGDTAYIANNQAVYRIDLSDNGDLDDTYPVEPIRGATFYHKPVLIDEDNLLIGSYNNKMYLFDIENGSNTEFFTTAKNRWIGTPLFEDGIIYAPNSNGILYAIDLDGEELWNVETKAAIWAKPVVYEGILFVASQDHHLYAVNARTGDEIWDTDLGASAVSSPVIDEDGTLYIGTFNSQVFAIDASSGDILWVLDTEDWVWGSPVLGPENTLFVTDFSANLYAIDTTSQDFIWEKQVEASTSITGSVLLHNDSLYVVTRSGAVVSYDLDGERLWKEELGEETGEFYGTPVAAGDNLILVSAVEAENYVYAYDNNLEPLWQFMPEN
ncbi:MAG: PQQ-binding-like beta-propeller repeat protein [Anaerolineales bacterium]|jgi:outer membrane protein assembly factor BamB